MIGLRCMLGVCAQTNIMSPELTCDDHLRLFAQLKGVESSDVDAAVCCETCFNKMKMFLSCAQKLTSILLV